MNKTSITVHVRKPDSHTGIIDISGEVNAFAEDALMDAYAQASTGNPRAEVLFVTGSRMFRLLFAPAAEPSADDRAALVELARAAARK